MGMPSQVKENLKNAQLILESLKRDHEQALLRLGAYCVDHADQRDAAADGGGEVDATAQPRVSPVINSDVDSAKVNHEKVPLIKAALNQIQSGLDDSEVMYPCPFIVGLCLCVCVCV